MSKVHVALWALWIVAAIGSYFAFGAADGTPVVWLLGAFAVLEAWGVIREGRGDTLTENIRSFYRGGWSRGFLVIGFTLFLGLWVISAVPGGRFEYLYPWAGFSLGASTIVWLLFHFLRTDGSWG